MYKSWLRVAAALLLIGLLTGCQCSHEWREADCITPKTCSKCDLTEGEALPHQWQDATCSKAKTCILCGAEEGNKLAHDYQFDAGYMRCSMCRAKEPGTEIIEPLSFPSETMTEAQREAFIDLNGQNNLRNNARFQYQDGLYYGQYWDEAGQSLVISTDLVSGSAILLDYGWAKNIYIADGNIYYENIQPDTQAHGIYRINIKNGAYVSQDKISDAYGSMQVKGDYIYYSDFSNQYISDPGDEVQQGLYRCDLDGGNVTMILDKPIYEFYVFDTGILYQDREDGETLHICYPDGSGDIKLNDQKSTSAIFDGEFIYYLSNRNKGGKETESYTCWKMRPDGSENQQVAIHKIFNAFLIHDGKIFFCNANGKSQLYRMNLDGSKATAVTKDVGVYYVQILNGELKYTKFKNDYIEGNYLCGLNGKNLREFIPYA